MVNNKTVTIKAINAASVKDMNLGNRKHVDMTTIALDDSLFLRYMIKNTKLKIKKSTGECSDLICVKFQYSTREYESMLNKAYDTLKEFTIDSNIAYKFYIKMLYSNYTDEELIQICNKANCKKEVVNKLLYVNKIMHSEYKHITKDKLRIDLYKNGFNYEGKHYVMLYRSSAKAKQGQVIFINDKLYKQAYDWLTMGIVLPKENAKIVEMSAYAPLTTSTIVSSVHIPVKDILIIKDIESLSYIKAMIVSTDENNDCICAQDDHYQIKNTLWDGMSLIQEDLLKDYNSFGLLRQHFFKACAFKCDISGFYKDYCRNNNLDYETHQVQDIFGNWHYIKDIKMITTENAIKWINKFDDLMGDNPYEYWCKKVQESDSIFGIVKEAHESKIQDGLQQMSYQMINTLPLTRGHEIEEMTDILQESINFINRLKNDNDYYVKYLKHNASNRNSNMMMVDLYKHNKDIAKTEIFESYKGNIISKLKKSITLGKVLNKGDNLTLLSNPIEMLYKSICPNFNVESSTTFNVEKSAIQGYTKQFENGEYIACFRNPHNSPNNICHMHNVHHASFDMYLNKIESNVLIVNSIGTDIQDRMNSCDFDSDFVYATNQKTIVKLAKKACEEYYTIVNKIDKSKRSYNNTPEDYAKMDNDMAKARLAIGESSNLAQLAMSYYYDAPSKELLKYVCTGSVLAQVAIDNCKRVYECDIDKEIMAIRNSPLIKGNYLPSFYVEIKKQKMKKSEDKKKLEKRVGSISCPMNLAEKIVNNNVKNVSLEGQYIEMYINKKILRGTANNRQVLEVINIIRDLNMDIKKNRSKRLDKEESVKNEEKLISIALEKINKKTISKVETFNAIIKKALKEENSDIKIRLLNALYYKNNQLFLDNFCMSE